ncbi:tRNA (adenosine(37)-N6)-threonylcarbamoyltransferase complex dimerization subunit type 1 TsaB [Pseudonocardia spinosispora]|uniref:tRNA (adenosine(37)-N6)-threonylcarbamoyltransferase complex dimerization subunit type 1 TsaB n=1 Tax=Pseudonocardia spinosispora TaxID=103441 RepID=UPI0003F7D3FA|nr:tRNA (adenosine(37)-N6)-threonylcarbamoyltransferase complex dimerization subunit type 1 TsaB [Pseudonocardia spinosispora]
MLVLALDTSTDAVVVGLLDVPATGAATVLATETHPGARRHGEQLMPSVLAVCDRAGHRTTDLDAVVCGAGPGPFTGLRVGMVTAAGLGDALEIPVYGVCSLDAIAAQVEPGEPLLVVSDARRREVYWAVYDALGQRVQGPSVDTPAEVASLVGELGVRRVAGPVAGQHEFGLPEYPRPDAALAPSPSGLVSAAGDDLRGGATPAPLEPHYLRRPDAVPPGARKRVSPVASGA